MSATRFGSIGSKRKLAYGVVSWTRRAEKTSMREAVEVVPERVGDVAIDYCARLGIARSIAVTRALWVEANVVPLAADDIS